MSHMSQISLGTWADIYNNYHSLWNWPHSIKFDNWGSTKRQTSDCATALLSAPGIFGTNFRPWGIL